MYFEIIGDISAVETIAAGAGIRKSRGCEGSTGVAGGESEKVLPA